MTLTAKKDFERVFLSVFIAAVIHLFIFFVLPLMVNFHPREIPKYSGPIYVTLGEVPSISLGRQAEKEARRSLETSAVKKEKQAGRAAETFVLKSQSSADLVNREQIFGPAEKTGQVKNTVNSVTQRALWKELPSGKKTETAAPATSASEKSSSALIEERASNIPFVPPVPLKETKAETKQAATQNRENQQNMQVLGENVYSSLDKLLKGSNQPPAAGTAGETGKTQGALNSNTLDSGSGVPIQWEEPSAARKALYMPKPAIPKWVSREGVTLKIVISFKLLPEGIISKINVEKSSGYSDIDAAVTEALRRWKFQAVRGDRVVNGRITYVIKPE